MSSTKKDYITSDFVQLRICAQWLLVLKLLFRIITVIDYGITIFIVTVVDKCHGRFVRNPRVWCRKSRVRIGEKGALKTGKDKTAK